MFSGLINWLSNAVSVGIWVALVISSIVTLLALLVSKIPVLQASPINKQAKIVVAIGATVTLVLMAIKLTMFIVSLFSTQADNAKLRAQLKQKDARIEELTKTDQRKEQQGIVIDTADRKADVIYDVKWRTIEKIVKQPDLSLANRLALDLTTNFYTATTEELDDAEVPSN